MSSLTRISLLLAAVVACSPDTPATIDPVATDIRTEAAYRELTTASFAPVARLCKTDAEICTPPVQPNAAVSGAGDVLVRGLGAQGDIVVRVPAGSQTPVPLGRVGSGPGEYRIPATMGFTPDGDAVIYDLMARRVVRFAPDGTGKGEATRGLPPAPLIGFGVVRGEVWMLSTDRPKTSGDTMPVDVVSLGNNETAAQKLHRLALSQPAHALEALRTPAPLFAPVASFGFFADGGVAFTDGRTLVVDLFDAEGVLAKRVGFDVTSRAVTEADAEARRARNLGGVADARMRESMERMMSNVSARHAAITRLITLSNGEVWVRETPREAADSVSWVSFSREGAPLRRVWTGADDAVLAWAGDRYLITRLGGSDATDGYWWATLR
jgi:hypothetical protein